MKNEPVTKRTYFRKQSVEKLYKLLKQKVLIDMRKVKRFRIWQILVLKRKLSLFMRRVRETNRCFLKRNLISIIEVLKKPLSYSFRRIQYVGCRPEVPKYLHPQLASLHLLQSSLKLMTRSCALSQFPQWLQSFHLLRRSFGLWKSRAYPASPFLRRNRVLLLSVLSIVLHHRWENLNFAFQKVSRIRERTETIPLCKAILKVFQKKMFFAFRKVNQPRFSRRKVDKKAEFKVFVEKVKTSSILLEIMIKKKKRFDSLQRKLELLKSFNLWKLLTNENQVPKFIMKRHSRSWACKILAVSIENLVCKVRRMSFRMFKVERKTVVVKDVFPIDRLIIENQARVLEKLESQHHHKSREVKRLKKLEKINKIRVFFWKGLKYWMDQWKILLFAPDDQQKLFEYLRQLESQAEGGQDSVELTGVRAIIERRSTEITNKLLDSDSGINFKSL